MNLIKRIFRELFKIILEAVWGYAIGIFVLTLVIIALKEIFRVFLELGLIQFIGIASGLIFIFGILDHWQGWDIFITISEFIDDLFKEED
jgi:hypothetical protein